MKNKKKIILFLDSGDTFVDESTEIYDENGIVIKADLIEGAKDFLNTVYKDNFTIALVADGEYASFENVYKSYGLWHVFDKNIVSSDVGIQKPSKLMFETAMKELNLNEEDKYRIVMIGNNLRKDILGANNMNIISIWMNWSQRYYSVARDNNEKADYEVKSTKELLSLIYELENKL